MGIILGFIMYTTLMSISGKKVSIFGYRMYVVKTDSMEPTIKVDSVILVHEEDITKLDKGTIITFDFNKQIGIPNTHRIVGYYYEYLDGNEIKYDSTLNYDTVEELLKDNPSFKVIGYRTQGDNPECGVDLKPVKFDAIEGVYTKDLVIVTFLFGLLNNLFGFLLIILIPLFILLIIQLVSLYKMLQI